MILVMRLFYHHYHHRRKANAVYRFYATGFPVDHYQRTHNTVARTTWSVQRNYINLSSPPLKIHDRLPYRLSRNKNIREMMSVSGIIYDVEEDDLTMQECDTIIVTLFTKEGCTLCDKVQDVLKSMRSKYPHRLVAIDITDPVYKDQWYEKYKYDIPVLHVNDNIYWAKHRITPEQAVQCFQEIQKGIPITLIGTEPNAVHSRPKGTNSNSS